MLENPAFGLGLLGGIVLGGLAVGAWISARLRARFDGELCHALARAQFAETLTEELRRGEQVDQAEVGRLRGELADAVRARAIAETQAEETVKRAEE
ncbi:MAG TPA: hypothetical protein VFR82_13475 [Nitrospira sp.]|nr:hypothetical protein [Nitrospira sp.]